jgi:hypothetical protein
LPLRVILFVSCFNFWREYTFLLFFTRVAGLITQTFLILMGLSRTASNYSGLIIFCKAIFHYPGSNLGGGLGVFEPRDAARKYPRQDPLN